jgi:hypothetical protein
MCAIQRKAWKFGLRRRTTVPLSVTLAKDGDIGYCAGMVIADGSILETLVDSGHKRSNSEGATPWPRRYYSTPQLKVSMEDKESVDRLAQLWGRKATLRARSSTGNDAWGLQVGGKKALGLIKLMMPYVEGPDKRKAIFLLARHKTRTSIPVKSKLELRRFEGLI